VLSALIPRRTCCFRVGAARTVRIHDDVGADALVGEWHVLLIDDDAAHAFLTVPTASGVFKAERKELARM